MTQDAAIDNMKERRLLADQDTQKVEKNAYFNETIQNNARIFSVNPLSNATDRQHIKNERNEIHFTYLSASDKGVVFCVFVSQVMWQFKKEEDLFQIRTHLWMEVLLRFTQV